MLLTKIMTSFHNYPRQWLCQFDHNLDIYSFAFLSGTQNFESNVLYFGNVSDLPPVPPSLCLTFVCIADTEVPADYRTESISTLNLITLEKTVSQMEILRILTGLFGDAARVSSGRAHLIEVLHSNQGLQAIVDMAYRILQNPIIVVDSSYKILAMYQDVSASGGRSNLEEQRSLGYMLKENVEAMRKARLYEQTRENGYPFYNKDEQADYGWITCLYSRY